MTDASSDQADFLNLSADIVSAYVANNSLSVTELPALLQSVHAVLVGLSTQDVASSQPEAKKDPAVPIKKSVTPDYIVCLEDGKKFKSLKRHLRTVYSMTPEEYRAKWGLPRDYPMVAPSYAQKRSELAMSMGLGRQRSKAPARGRAKKQ